MSTDIQTTHFVFRNTPDSWHPYIKVARLDRPIGTWLLLIPCWWGLTLGHHSVFYFDATAWLQVVLFGLGAILMRSAGCIINDLWDVKLDAQVERTKTRPLASGEMTRKQAFIFLAILLATSLAILASFQSILMLALGALSLVLVVSYPFMKRITWWPQAFLGITFNWGALMGYAAATGTIDATALLLYAGGILWTLAYDTIYAHQDTADDALIGVKSTALLFGDKSKKYVSWFFAGAIALFLAAKIWSGSVAIFAPLLTLPLIIHAIWQIKNWKQDDTASCLAIFKSNRLFGLLVLLMISL